MNFEDVAALALAEGDLDVDEELAVILLVEEYKRRRRRRRRQPKDPTHIRLNLKALTPKRFRKLFRVQKRHFYRLLRCLQLPDIIRCPGGTVVEAEYALCILLRRLSYPCRLEDLSSLLGFSESQLSLIVNTTVSLLYDSWDYLLTDLTVPWLTDQRLAEFCRAIRAAGSPYNSLWGFIDGTTRPICRPHRLQEEFYSGHKRHHVVKFQAVLAPNGLIAHLYGPLEGRRHDMALLEESGLRDLFSQHMSGAPDGPQQQDLLVFGDQGYAMEQFVQTPFRGHHLTPNQARFNNTMKDLRVTVEWGFGRVASVFAYCDYRKSSKVFLSPIGKYYRVSCLLTNCLSCLRPNQVSKKFGVRPPHLEEYLS